MRQLVFPGEYSKFLKKRDWPKALTLLKNPKIPKYENTKPSSLDILEFQTNPEGIPMDSKEIPRYRNLGFFQDFWDFLEEYDS